MDEITGNVEINELKIGEVKDDDDDDDDDDDALVDILINSVELMLNLYEELIMVDENVDVFKDVDTEEDEVKEHDEKDFESTIMDEVDEALALLINV